MIFMVTVTWVIACAQTRLASDAEELIDRIPSISSSASKACRVYAQANGLSFVPFPICFITNPMGFETAFDNVAFKGIDALRKKIH